MPSGVYKRKEGIIYGNTGKKASVEKIERLRISHLGQKVWNKGIKTGSNPKHSERMKGRKHTIETRKKMLKSAKRGKENHRWKGGLPKCKECRKELSYYKGVYCIDCVKKGDRNPKWIKDRTKLAKKQERGDSAYREWRNQILKRDRYICKINNKDCSGKKIVHHILSWQDFPELRYNINNGITLCQAHHPRKRAEEKRLIPFFQGLVSVSKELV